MKLKRMLLLSGCLLVAITNGRMLAATNQLERLTLAQAFDLAARLNPELAEARARLDVAGRLASQTGALPNPELVAGVESAPIRGGGDAEYLAGFSQAVPLGGRLARAREAGRLETEQRQAALAGKWREVRRRIHAAHATALYQQQAGRVQSELAESLTRTLDITHARVASGDALPAESARAEMELARARVGAERARSAQTQALAELASAIGDSDLPLLSVEGNLDLAFAIPSLESLTADLADHPVWRGSAAEVRAERAGVALARAERIPDLNVELLYRRVASERRDGVDIGFRVPLPLFNANRGRIQAAEAEVQAADARSRATQNELRRNLRATHAQLTAALAAHRTLKEEILPRAETVARAAEARYAAGDTSLSEVLPARRDWASVQLDQLEALRAVMESWAELNTYLSADEVE